MIIEIILDNFGNNLVGNLDNLREKLRNNLRDNLPPCHWVTPHERLISPLIDFLTTSYRIMMRLCTIK